MTPEDADTKAIVMTSNGIPLRLSTFKGKTDTTPVEVERTWAELLHRFANPVVRQKKDGQLFSGARFEPPYRLLVHVREVSVLILDVDTGALNLDTVKAAAGRLGVAFGLYSTHSHKRKTERNPNAEPRWRVCYPLLEPVPVGKYNALWQFAADMTGLPVDESTKDASRMFYTPVKHSASSPYEHYHCGDKEFLDWTVLGLEEPQPAEPVEKPEAEFKYHEDRHMALVTSITFRGKLNRRGKIDARCLSHNGSGNTALMFNPATGAVKCNNDCSYSDILAAEGLPAGQLPKRPAEKKKPKQTRQEPKQVAEPEWTETVDGVVLLNDIATQISRFMVMKPAQLVAVSLWIFVTYVFEVFDLCAYLELKSPTKQCGKTRLLEVAESLSCRARSSSGISPAALFRVIESEKPTLILDEQEDLADKPELLQILNAGYRVGGTVTRCGGPNNTDIQTFSVYCPKAFASIKGLPETTASRCIAIELQRKHRGEKTENWRVRHVKSEEFESIRRRARRWATDNTQGLRLAEPEVPQAIANDRQQDNWRALLAVADAAGGDWPRLARDAAIALSEAVEDSEQASLMLLGDVRNLFSETGADAFSSAELQKELVALESKPWGDWRRGKPISANAIARLLRDFKIFPTKFRDGTSKEFRGYPLSLFNDAFTRYLPSNAVSTVSVSHPVEVDDLRANSNRLRSVSETVDKRPQLFLDTTGETVRQSESGLGGVLAESDFWAAGPLQREMLEDGSSYDIEGAEYPLLEDTSWEG